MLKKLLSIFTAENPLAKVGEEFAEMLRLACQMTVTDSRSALMR